MAIAIVFLAVIGAIAAWWLSQQGLMTKPWLETGPLDPLPGAGPPLPTVKIGLGVFLAVAGALFALFASAYVMRMQAASDWRTLPKPGLLWLNTGILILSSAALQWAWVSARRGRIDGVRNGVHAGGVSALAFLAAQLLAWRQLSAAGYYAATNPANAFFYLLTAVHGVHLLGGLVALARAAAKVWRGRSAEQVRLSVELCAIYWHFLLVVWLFLFALLLLT
jgi:cytochrome c oxidase subunit 3